MSTTTKGNPNTDPAVNLLYNEPVMAILNDTRAKLEAMGIRCAMVPGEVVPREDKALSITLFIAPSDDALLDLRAAERLASDFANSTQGAALFVKSRLHLQYEEAQASNLTKSVQWVLSQGVDLKNDGNQWVTLVDRATDMFDVDIEELEACLRDELGLKRSPPSELRPNISFGDGVLTIRRNES